MKSHFVLFIITTFLILPIQSLAQRNPEHPIDAQFLKRQSKYNLERKLTNDQMKNQLMSLFEAARWSASCFNNQPWRFIYALHGTKEWSTLNSLISTRNQQWVKNAGALVLVLSTTTYERNGNPAPTHTFDTGLAVSQFLLQASNNNLIAHTMEVHDYEKARKTLSLGKEYSIEAMIAVGEESTDSAAEFASRDSQPSTRKAVAEIAFEGSLPKALSLPSKKKIEQSEKVVKIVANREIKAKNSCCE